MPHRFAVALSMAFFLLKVGISALVIAVASEISKRSGFWGSLLVSLPLMSILTMTWVYLETRDTGKISSMSWEILWLVLPTLPFFVIIPSMLKKGVSFPITMIVACAVTALLYVGTVRLIK